MDRATREGASDEESERVRGELLRFYQKTHKRKDELTAGDFSALEEACAEADALASRVSRPREQSISAEVFYDLSDIGAQRTQRLTEKAGKFSATDVIDALKRRFGAEDGEEGINWKQLGLLASRMVRPAVGVTCMLGPLGVESKRRASIHRQRTVVSGPTRAPDRIEACVSVDEKSRQTDKNMETMIKLIRQEGAAGVPFVELVLNPRSFAQTMENIFALSFLVKDRRVHISQDTELGVVVTARQRPPPPAQAGQGTGSKPCENALQSILKFNMHIFSAMKAIVSEDMCKMPHRRAIDEGTGINVSHDQGALDGESELHEPPYGFAMENHKVMGKSSTPKRKGEDLLKTAKRGRPSRVRALSPLNRNASGS